MSEYMSAEIWLGGPIAQRLIPGLCKVITEQNVATDWGDGQFRPGTADDLLAACTENGEGVRLLHLLDDQARWGQFELLEAFLRRHKIGYTRRSEGKWEYVPSYCLPFHTCHVSPSVLSELSASRRYQVWERGPGVVNSSGYGASGGPGRQARSCRSLCNSIRSAQITQYRLVFSFESS